MSEPDLTSSRYDPTGKYEIKWVDGEVTCQCGAWVKGGMRPCNHIKWLKLRNRLPQMPRAQRDMIVEQEASQPKTLGEAIVGTPEEQEKREPMVCFPLIESSAFPMLLSTFLDGLKSVVVEHRRGGTADKRAPTVWRQMEDIGDGMVKIHWSSVDEKGNPLKGHLDIESDKLIEHREWRMGKTQYTIMGAGGCLWIDGDKVTCTTDDGEQMDVEAWLRELAGRHPQ